MPQLLPALIAGPNRMALMLGLCCLAFQAQALDPSGAGPLRPVVAALVMDCGGSMALPATVPLCAQPLSITWLPSAPRMPPQPMKAAAGPVPRMPDPYRALFHRIARETRVPVALIAAVAAAESGFDPMARSPKGATGLMQLMPDTARRFNVLNLLSPEDNLRGGANYLRWLSERFGHDMERVIAAYNAGEGAVERAGGTPAIPETLDYLPKVLRYLEHFDKALPERPVAPARRV